MKRAREYKEVSLCCVQPAFDCINHIRIWFITKEATEKTGWRNRVV